jgi:uncharacterized protein YuzE
MFEHAEAKPFYIRYPGGRIVKCIEVGGEGSDVIADVDEAGTVVGIEIVDVNIPQNVALARSFAAARGLAFPDSAGPAA